MTLIALTLNHGYPVLMADLLLSHPEGEETLPLPTFVNGNKQIFSKREDLKPFGLCQKLYIINDRLCVALGGTLSLMETMLRRLKVIYDDASSLDVNDVFKYIDDFYNNEGAGLDIIALACTPVNDREFDYAVHARGRLRTDINSSYDKIVAAGSGARQFIDFIKTNPKFESDLIGTDASLYMNQSLVAYWLGQEISRGESLSNLWGAGYEMIVFRHGRFVKLDQYTVVLLKGEFGSGVVYQPAPFSTMLISYENDILIIRVILHDHEKTFYVPAIDDSRDQIELIDHPPEHDLLMIIYILTDVDTGVEYTPCIIRPYNINEWDQSPIVFKNINGPIVIGTDSRTDRSILDRIIKTKESNH